MKILCFDEYQIGLLSQDQVIDVTDIVDPASSLMPKDRILHLITHYEKLRPALEQALNTRDGRALEQVTVRPPLPQPKNIVCMAVNYMENGTLTEPPPINAFYKAPTTVIGQGGTMVLPDVAASVFEGEAELALVIGKRATNVSADQAMNHIFGYTNFIDGSARGLGPANNIFFQMKSRDTFAPMGPVIVTADEIVDPQALQIRLWNNGELMQDFNTNDMAHKIPRCIEWLSSIHTLEPGDIVATGTNHRGLHPFQDGDLIEIEGQGLERLRFSIKDPLERQWARQTRLQRQQQGHQSPNPPQLTGKYAVISR